MTDNDIIKAMQCVIGYDASCSECTYQKALRFPSCRNMCAKNALDLINRQKAEIEKLNIELEAMRSAANSLKLHYENAKSEAVKEFAERICEGRVSNDPVVIAVKVELECMKK